MPKAKRGSQARPRCRDLGLALGGRTGALNLITDVPGVAVGQVEVIKGKSRRGTSAGVARTGVTTIVYLGRDPYLHPLRCAVHVINGYGKATGLDQVRETGRIETPVCLTNTLSVWCAAETVARLTLSRHPQVRSVSPVVGECNDGYLNDIRGFHVKPSHVRSAVRHAGRRFALGSVGAGVGMRGLGYKSGVGSASRLVSYRERKFALGVLALVNTGDLQLLRFGGFPVGRILAGESTGEAESGSVVFVLATDGNFTSRQLGRLAVRATHGLARAGVTSSHDSGDFVIAFSTHAAPELARTVKPYRRARAMPPVAEEDLSQFFVAAVEATEEAFLDGILTASGMDGVDGRYMAAIDAERIHALVECSGMNGKT